MKEQLIAMVTEEHAEGNLSAESLAEWLDLIEVAEGPHLELIQIRWTASRKWKRER